MGNDISKEKSIQIINYYIFHKKIDNIITKGENPLNAKMNEISIYIMNLQWIKNWKLYTNYEVVQKEFDKIEDDNENSLITKLNERCDELIKDGTIKNSNDFQPDKIEEYNHFDFGNKVLDLQFFKDEVLEALVDDITFTSFFGYLEQIFNFKNIINITGIIQNKIFILMMKQNNRMKLFYQGEMEKEIKLIQLTVKFPNETIFDKYCQFYKTYDSDTIIKSLNKIDAGYLMESKTKDNCIFTNEFLNLKYLMEKIKNKSINFQNIRTNFVKLTKISSLPYLNAVIQNLVNISPLTSFLFDESNFNKINYNKNLCYFTCFICQILSNLYFVKNINSYNLNDLDELIYLIQPKFKFDENCIPGELIKFILETINIEFYEFFSKYSNINTNISTIISNTFLCVSKNISKCINCQSQEFEYKNSFLFEFYLDIIYNRYIGTKDLKMKNEKYVLTLEHCFKHFIEPFNLDSNDCFCNKCRKNTKHKVNNDLFNLPNVLIISVNKESDTNDKYIFSFPEKLELKNFINNQSISKNYKYYLIGAISHKKNRKEYYAFCKHSESNIWYKCNDLNIEICSNPLRELLNQNVDVLIYESSFDGSTGSINSENRINKSITYMQKAPNNKFNSMNNDDDDDGKTIRLLEERLNTKL